MKFLIKILAEMIEWTKDNILGKFINRKTLDKVFNEETVLYLIFGVLTTLVNWGAFWVIRRIFNVTIWPHNVVLSIQNVLAWIITIVFAFYTNKVYVFKSEHEHFKQLTKEFFSFSVGRLFSLLVETVGLLFLVNVGMSVLISKVVMSVVVIIINYFVSKLFVFKN